MSDLNEFLKKAFEYKNLGEYKKAIDYFYKALALDNTGTEIMFELAQMYTKLCQYDRAVSFLEQITTADRNNFRAKFELALVYKKLNDLEAAKNLLEELAKTDFDKEQTAKELFPIYVAQKNYTEILNKFHTYFGGTDSSIILYYAALAYENTDQKQTAEEYYNKSLKLNPENVETGIKIAEILFEKNNFDEAENLAYKLLKYTEDDRLMYILGEIDYINGNLDSAIKHYSYAIKQNNSNAEYYFKLAIVFSLKGFGNEAENCYERAIALEPENPTYNYGLAYLYYTNNKIEQAEKLAKFILEKEPDNLDAKALLILILLKENNIIDSGKLVRETEKENSANDFLCYAHYIYYAKLNMWKKALEPIKQAIKLNDNSIDYKYELAKNYFYLADFEEAEKICEEITNKAPKYIQAYILAAKIKLQKQDFTAAQSILEKAMKLDINSHEIYTLLGDINYENENYKKALENYKTALSINPNDEKYYENTAKCYFMLKDFECAYLYYKEAAEFDITNAKYRYFMAKCSELNDDKENAIFNYSVMKRLEPNNIEYIKEYALYLKKIGNRHEAEGLIKNLMKCTDEDNKADLQIFVKDLKK